MRGDRDHHPSKDQAEADRARHMAIHLTERINAAPVSGFQLRIVALCALVALIDGLDIQAMAIATPRIAERWGMAPSAFAPVLSASLAGIMLGTMTLGLLGDRFGRRPVVLGAFAAVGLTSMATALADSIGMLALLRFVTGFAIGGCLPNVTALTTEYMPSRRAGAAVTLMYAAVPLGGVMGSVVAADLIGWIDWEGIFLLGGVLPLLICLLLYAGLPESGRFLVRKGGEEQRIGAMLERIDRDYIPMSGDRFAIDGQGTKAGSVADLLREGRLPTTLLLWLIFFFSMSVMYLMNSWLPSIFTAAGWPMRDAIGTLAFFQIGGIVGGLLGGWLLDRVGAYRVLCSAFLLGAVSMAGIGLAGKDMTVIRLLVTGAGFGIIGAQLVLTALAAIVYPTIMRATGIGWALGIGRLGAVVSPMLGGLALQAGFTPSQLFLSAVGPTLLCAVGAIALMRVAARHSIP